MPGVVTKRILNGRATIGYIVDFIGEGERNLSLLEAINLAKSGQLINAKYDYSKGAIKGVRTDFRTLPSLQTNMKSTTSKEHPDITLFKKSFLEFKENMEVTHHIKLGEIEVKNRPERNVRIVIKFSKWYTRDQSYDGGFEMSLIKTDEGDHKRIGMFDESTGEYTEIYSNLSPDDMEEITKGFIW